VDRWVDGDASTRARCDVSTARATWPEALFVLRDVAQLDGDAALEVTHGPPAS
jgi:hypothetical protein